MPPLAAVPDLDRELDDLYGLPLEDFTRTRNELARRLKRAHQAEAAAQVQALRKPSLTAWTVNQLSRREPDLVDTLLAAGESLRDAQTRALGGHAAAVDVQDASATEREAVRALVSAARSLLGVRATPAQVEKLSQTLRASAIDEDARPLLERGRLTEEVQVVGFGPLAAVRPVAAREEDKRKRQAMLKELRAEARRSAQDAAHAERAADDAEREARRLREEANSRRAAADRTAAAVAAAES